MNRRPRNSSLILVALALSILFWILEAVLHVLVFQDSDLLEQMFTPPAHEAWMRLTVMALFVIFAVYSVRSVEARRRAEAAALQVNAELAQIFETAADGMRVVDQDFTVLRANDTFAAMAGVSKEAIIGKKCYEVFKGPLCDTPDCPLTQMLNNQERVEYDADKERQNGSKVPCIITATPFRRPNGEILGIVEDFKDISERRQAEIDLTRSQERLRQLTSHLQEVREEEQTRIARELHDELGQAMTALSMDLHWLRSKLPDGEPELLEKTEAMTTLIGSTAQSVSRICSELRPCILDDFGLSAAIEWQAHEFSARTGIPCEITMEPKEILVDPQLTTTVFRIFQETLTNIIRHAHATRVQASLRLADGLLEMQVCDNGTGFTPRRTGNNRSFGLIGIRERVRDRNGEFQIDNASTGGTCVKVRIPSEGCDSITTYNN